MTVSTSSLDARKIMRKVLSCQHTIDTRKAHDMLSTRPLPVISDPTQPMQFMEEAHSNKAYYHLWNLSG